MTPDLLHHGGRLAEAARLYGGDPAQWLDLSTGLNPAPWSPPEDLRIDWHALPDPEALAALERTAARHFGAEPRHVCAVPGSETALRLLAGILDLPGRALAPAYRTHAEAFARSRPITFAAPAEGAEAVVLANPNNPDGLLREPAAVLDWHDAIAAQSGWLIADEAFADCHPQASAARHVADDRRLIVLRSFGKFFGLAGLRLGFVIAPRHVLDRLRALTGSWPLHTAALELGSAAYADAAWIERTRAELPGRAAALDAVLERHGLSPQGACPLFRYLSGVDAGALFERLAKARILTRPFAERPDTLRLGVPADPAALDRLDRALGNG
ncbi:pyridoxal phosphate-dependent class II aminotransferase [Novosphingobium resinovorum]|uniref:threonine-phosphate decarboxylase n=1 Tax=Novosphingobium TaxID=165696 RepID=UPI001B3C67EE|nr:MULTISPECIES: threonine-phosphate decarboxylase [Novosphingobium]MBF7013218.1 pyridoxal phosphate-dependent class II aminotransferase [Novosphingobium sp. HR1a]WJM27943.1 pyridoxal phosphate-dependent class II aminotransferase [Novosphingobium resinovorum]